MEISGVFFSIHCFSSLGFQGFLSLQDFPVLRSQGFSVWDGAFRSQIWGGRGVRFQDFLTSRR